MEIKLKILLKGAVFSLLVIITVSCTNGPARQVKSLERAMNSHESGRILPLFTDDVNFSIAGYHRAGLHELGKVVEWDSVLNARYAFYEIRGFHDTIFFKADLINDLNQAMGLGKVATASVFIILDEGRIAHLNFSMTPEYMEMDQHEWRSVMPWAMKNRPDQVRELMPEGRLIINGKSASGWLAIFNEWRDTTSE